MFRPLSDLLATCGGYSGLSLCILFLVLSFLSTTNPPRPVKAKNCTVTVTARGYGEGRTLTVWRDANLDGQRHTGERVLCEVVVESNGKGRCDFTVFVPPFVGGSGSARVCPVGTATSSTRGRPLEGPR